MKRILITTIWIVILSAGICFGRERLANEKKDGLYVRSIERVLRLEPDEIDLATAALIISEQWSDLVHGRRYLARLDDMSYEILDRIRNKRLEGSYKVVNVINQYLFDELRFTTVKDADDPDDLFLHSVMDRKKGYCLSLSILYLSLGERLGLPLYGVVVPGHFFIRYDDGQIRFNIETTGKGGYLEDKHYINHYKVPEGRRNSIYMVNLDKLQTLGCFFNNLGNAYSDIGDFEKAMLALERAVEINPSLAESRFNLGNTYLRHDRIEDAIYEYRAALKINPDDAKIHSGLGGAYTRRGWLNQAIAEYSKSLKLDENLIEAYKGLASVYCQKEMFKTAIAYVKEAQALEPKNASLYERLGDIYFQMGNYDRAIFQHKQALKIDRDSASAYFGLGICYNKLDRFDDEIRAYKKALSIQPGMFAALANLGNVYFGKKDYDEAIEYYKKAAEIKPEESTVLCNIGVAYSNKNDFEQAVESFLDAIDVEPEMGDAHNGLAFAYYRLQDYELAAKHIRKAEELGAEVDENLIAAIHRRM